MSQPSWGLHPEAEAITTAALDRARRDSRGAASFADELLASTSGRLVDWLDHLGTPVAEDELSSAGFVAVAGSARWRHPGALLPDIVVSDRSILGIHVDSIEDFVTAVGAGAVRRRWEQPGAWLAGVDLEGPVELCAVERWSQRVTAASPGPGTRAQLDRAAAQWSARSRRLPAPEGLADATAVASAMVDDAGADIASTAALRVERGYWQSRNRAGRVQFRRQHDLGLGWGNHDHHTFRSSRACFSELIKLFTVLGFELRERFHAGEEAGWGAQVLEHPGTGAVIFADVDLRPGEGQIDFSDGFADAAPAPAGASPAGSGLGTVGAWCALHGESVLAAGMHHLAARFDFDRLEADLAALGVSFRPPFSELAYLRQAFTDAEPWSVSPEKVKRLVAAGDLVAPGAQGAVESAPGSHLENIARRQGHKGFNQHSVSTTIRATDPRAAWSARA